LFTTATKGSPESLDKLRIFSIASTQESWELTSI
jgi:hypothetical protein